MPKTGLSIKQQQQSVQQQQQNRQGRMRKSFQAASTGASVLREKTTSLRGEQEGEEGEEGEEEAEDRRFEGEAAAAEKEEEEATLGLM